jgi:hypothetical protein
MDYTDSRDDGWIVTEQPAIQDRFDVPGGAKPIKTKT